MPLSTLLDRDTDPAAQRVDVRPQQDAQDASHAAKERRIHSAREVVHEADLRSGLGDSFEPQADERAEMAADGGQRDTTGGEVTSVQWPFETAAADGDDAAERGTLASEEREEVGDEAEARVKGQSGQQVEVLGRFW